MEKKTFQFRLLDRCQERGRRRRWEKKNGVKKSKLIDRIGNLFFKQFSSPPTLLKKGKPPCSIRIQPKKTRILFMTTRISPPAHFLPLLLFLTRLTWTTPLGASPTSARAAESSSSLPPPGANSWTAVVEWHCSRCCRCCLKWFASTPRSVRTVS